MKEEIVPAALEHLRDLGLNFGELEARMEDMVVKSLISMENIMGEAVRGKLRSGHSAFQVWAYLISWLIPLGALG